MKALAIRCYTNNHRMAAIALFEVLGYSMRFNSMISEQKYIGTIRAVTLRDDLSLGKRYEIMRSGGRSQKHMVDITNLNGYKKGSMIWHFISMADGITNTFESKQKLLDSMNTTKTYILCSKEILIEELIK